MPVLYKGQYRENERQTADWEKVLKKKHYLIKDVTQMYKELLKLNNNQTKNPIKT